MKKTISKKMINMYVFLSVLILSNVPVFATSQTEIETAWGKTKTALNVWMFILIIIGIFGVATLFITAGDDEQKQTNAKKWSIGIIVGVLLIGFGPTIAYSLIF